MINFFKRKTNNVSKIMVNGKTYTNDSNGPISIINNKVYINGELQTEGDFTKAKDISIQVLGDIERIESENSIKVLGNVTGNLYAKGSVNCDNVTGDIQAGGSVNCDNIGGNVQAGGSVNCDSIAGKVNKSFW